MKFHAGTLARATLIASLFLCPLVRAETATPTETPTETSTPVDTATPTNTPVDSATPTDTPTNTPVVVLPSPTDTPTPSASDELASLPCRVLITPLTSEANYNPGYLSGIRGTLRVNGQDVRIDKQVDFENRLYVRAFCGDKELFPGDHKVNVTWVIDDAYAKACTDPSHGAICVEYKTESADFTLSHDFRRVAELVLRNTSTDVITVKKDKVQVQIEHIKPGFSHHATPDPGDAYRTQSMPTDYDLWGEPQPDCDLSLTGVLGAPEGALSVPCPDGNCPNDLPTYTLDNGNVQAVVFPRSREGLEPPLPVLTAKYYSSPPGYIDATGLIASLPQDPPAIVTIYGQLVYQNGMIATCALKAKQIGPGSLVKVLTHSSCELFTALRRYFFYDPKAPDNERDTPAPVSYLGDDVVYGKIHPEVPFMGLYNLMADTDGRLMRQYAGGPFTEPDLPSRFFYKAILAAHSYVKDKSGKINLGDPKLVGEFKKDDLSQVRLYPYKNAAINPGEMMVLRAHLVAVQRKNKIGNSNIRGTGEPNAIPEEIFTPKLPGEEKGDRFIPMRNDSCPAVFRVNVPEITGQPLPDEVKNADLCIVSGQEKADDILSGRITVKLEGFVPQGPVHDGRVNTFPTTLIQDPPDTPATVVKHPEDVVQCINVPSDLTPSSPPFDSFKSCFHIGWVDGTGWTWVVKRTNCPQAGSLRECSKAVLWRVAWYKMVMLASMACALKYNHHPDIGGATTHGMKITSIPLLRWYGTHGNFEWYAKTTPKTGFNCVSCYLEPLLKPGVALGPINYGWIHQFTFGTIPRELAVDRLGQVRHWGSNLCDDGKTHLEDEGGCWGRGEACDSDKNENFVKPDGTVWASTAGGNLLGSFHFTPCVDTKYDISASWSPLVVDVGGKGIQISREFEKAVSFDIRGKGAQLVDWVENPNDVAFLVRPKNGKVYSVKQLFGDDKAENGFEALRAYDSNHDGKIDKSDRRFGELRLWFDRNRNGKVDPGEIEHLEKYGVDEIYLSYNRSSNNPKAPKKTLLGSYFNRKAKRFFIVEDAYFFEYWKNGKSLTRR